MTQLVALQARGTRMDIPSLLREVESIKSAKMRNEESALAMGENKAEASALSSYRQAAAAGDPNAISKLAGYPEHQRKVLDAFNGLSPEQAMAAKVKVREIGEAAQYVAGFPDGSTERAEAWNSSVDDLAGKGYITPDQAAAYKQSGPSDDILKQAMEVADFVEQQVGGKARTERLRGDKIIAETDVVRKRGEKVDADIGLTEDRGDTEKAKRGKITAESDLTRAKTTNVQGDTENESDLTKARVGEVGAKSDLTRAKTAKTQSDLTNADELNDAKVGKVKADTDLSGARTGQVRNKTGLETAESAAKVREDEADTGLKQAQTKKAEASIGNDADVAKARVKNYEDQIAKRTSKGEGGITPRDRVAIIKAVRELESSLDLAEPLPADASDEEKAARTKAEAEFEKWAGPLLAMLPENQPSKQGPSTIEGDTTKPAKSSTTKGEGTEAAPYTTFTPADFKTWPKGTHFINPADGKHKVKKTDPSG